MTFPLQGCVPQERDRGLEVGLLWRKAGAGAAQSRPWLGEETGKVRRSHGRRPCPLASRSGCEMPQQDCH